MQVGLVCAAPHPPPKTTTLAHANGLNPAVTNTLTFLGKERDYSAHFGVFCDNIWGGFGATGACSETFQLEEPARLFPRDIRALRLTIARNPGVTVSNVFYQNDGKLITYTHESVGLSLQLFHESGSIAPCEWLLNSRCSEINKAVHLFRH